MWRKQERFKKVSMSGIEFKMRQRIIRKFEKVGAISKKTAVSL